MNATQIFRYEKHDKGIVFAEFFAFSLLWIWPAIKTAAAFLKEKFIGRFSFYWIANSIITAIFYILSPLILYLKHAPIVIIAVSFILSINNGFVLRLFAEHAILPIFKNNVITIKKLPNTVGKMAGRVLQRTIGSMAQNTDLIKGNEDGSNDQ